MITKNPTLAYTHTLRLLLLRAIALCFHPKRSHPNNPNRVQAGIIYSMTFV
ncbi:hypothetical protein KBT16_26730 [Nostoc sp. CCCryo 231-06]|nr:hypothetical protein [Nostoc sp. CCCryo 231-06]